MKNTLPITFLFSLALLSLSACATAKKEAMKSLEQGNYEDAVSRFENLASREPNDPEIIAGLKSARTGYIGQKLIQARQTRMANNPVGAMDILLTTLSREQAWQVAPAGAAAFTQEEETGYALSFTKITVNNSIHSGTPLAGAYFIKRYAPLFPAKETAALTAKVQQKGKSVCQSFRKEKGTKKPYFDIFVASFCQYFGEKAGASSAYDAITPSLYSDIDLTIKVEGTHEGKGPEIQALFQKELKGGLMRTAWYDPKGKLKATGDTGITVNTQQSKIGTFQSHAYQEQESYIEKVSVQKERTVTYTDTVNTIDPITHQPKTTQVTRERKETYWTEEPQTKYRTVDRNYRYPAWQHDQSIQMALLGKVSLRDKTFDLGLSDKEAFTGIEHDENQPHMNLHPSKPKLINFSQWTLLRIQRVAADFAGQAARYWTDLFCKVETAAEGALSESGNRVHQCLRQPGAISTAFADNWYKKNLGLSVSEAHELLGAIK